MMSTTESKPARTAHYRIICQRAPRGAWSGFGKLETVCRSLDRDGFTYQTAVATEGDCIILTVTGAADRAKARKRATVRHFHPPAPPSLDKCQKMAAEARRNALRGGIVTERRTFRPSWYERRSDARRIGRVLARAIAQGRSSVTMDEMYGYGHGEAAFGIAGILRQKAEHRALWQDAPAEQGYTDARREAYRDYLYWRELEALSGQRERWKPGLTDETFYADDEVAA